MHKVHPAQSRKARNLAVAGLCTAFLAVIAPLSIMIGPISLTLSVLGVFFAGAMLTPGWAAASVLAYIALGAVGLPVFANVTGGVQVLVGLTAGYLWMYPAMAALVSWVCARTNGVLFRLLGILAAQAACYLVGTAWFVFSSGTEPAAALAVCVFPFVLPDFLKGAFALALAGAIRRRLKL